jgi:hypothetical protein
MWVQVRSAPSLVLAEMWKELFEGEGVPTRILPDPKSPRVGEMGSYQVLVPGDKTHVIEEILRKI